MDKRLAKRQKRKVARAKEQIRVSEPDVRTPEELRAAKDASRPSGVRGSGPPMLYNAPAIHNQGLADSKGKSEG